jgi:hypothetical protein
MRCPVTPIQFTYPLLALAEATILVHTRSRHPQNAPALRLWLQIQLTIFCIIEPTSFLSAPIYGRYFFICTLVSAAADLMVLYSVFYCLEDEFPAFSSVRAWSSTAILSGLLLCVAAGVTLPVKAKGIEIAWLTAVQSFTYIKAICLIMLSLYGYLRASSWPRDLAWTWMAMAVYGITETVVTRIQIIESNTNLLEVVTTIAAVLQLAGWWRALSYLPKPLTPLEIESASNLHVSNL